MDAVGTVPWDWYTDPAILRLEQDRIFRSSWQYVGHANEIAEPGSFRATRAGHVPVVLVRDEEGVLRAFLNVCRHRGSLVCEGSGRRTTLQCPYHAWTYGLDGRLVAAPRSDREGGIESDRLGLVSLRLEQWGPFLFVNADPEGPALSRRAGGRSRARRSCRHRRRLASIPSPIRVRAHRQLEDLRGELPRVLSLPGRASRLLGGRERVSGRIPARRRAFANVPDRPSPPRASRLVRPYRRGRARPVPSPLPEHGRERHAGPAEPLDRADPARHSRAHVSLPRLLRRA